MKRLISSWGVILILALGVVGCSQDDGSADSESDAVANAPTATIVDQVFDDTGNADEEDEPSDLHAPVVIVATNTPPPVTDTPEPTDTPDSTDTPEATAIPPTNTAAPIQPTSPPPPPPTAVPPTEPPPPPPPPPIGANGLVASSFTVDGSEFKEKESIWFEFDIANSTGGEVNYNSLGVMPKKDGVDRPEWYQQSWSGENSVVKPGGKSWKDNIKLPEAGDYTLRLVICFDGFKACTTGGGTFHSLSGEVPVTIRS